MSSAALAPLPTTKAGSVYFPALTGLRACAAYAVFWFHFNPLPPGSIPWMLVSVGNIGVNVFFVLSGFLICSRYMGRVEVSRPWLATFVRNRVARIYPMYLLVTLFTFFMANASPAYLVLGRWHCFAEADKGLVVFLNLTLLRGFFEQFLFTGIAPAWTLTVEECFYCLAPMLLLGLARARRQYALLLLYAVGLLVMGGALVLLAPHPFGFFASYKFMVGKTFFGRCVEFLAGMALALFIRDYRPKGASTRVTWAGLLWIAACVIVLARMDAVTTRGWSHLFINNLVLTGGIVLLLFGLIYEQTGLRRLLEIRLFQLLGKSSYVFYLIHMGTISLLLDRYLSTSSVVHFLVTVVLSIGLFRWVETPLHRWVVSFAKDSGSDSARLFQQREIISEPQDNAVIELKHRPAGDRV